MQIIIGTTTELNSKKAADFFVYLQANLKTSQIISKKKTFECRDGDTYSLSCKAFYQVDSATQAAHLHFIDESLGSGAFGKVYAIANTVRLGPITFKPSGYTPVAKPKVLKKQKNMSESAARTEYEIIQKVPHLNAEGYVWNEDSKHGYFLMNKIPGVELFKIIRQDTATKGANLTLENRLTLSSLILLALKTQVTDLKLIHYDIKPENIMVDFGPPIQVNIIDYGMARSLSNPVQRGGSTHYSAPERFKLDFTHSQKSDVFSLGRVLILIWGGWNKSYNAADNEYWTLIQNKDFYKLDELFTSIPINQQQVLSKSGMDKAIRSFLQKMIACNPEERLSIDKAIHEVNGISDQINHLVVKAVHNPNPPITMPRPSEINATPIPQALIDAPKIGTRSRNRLAVVGTLLFAGVGVALLLSGVLAPLGLSVLASVALLISGSLMGGVLGGVAGRRIDKSDLLGKKSRSSNTIAKETKTPLADNFNGGAQQLAKLGQSQQSRKTDNECSPNDKPLAAFTTHTTERTSDEVPREGLLFST